MKVTISRIFYVVVVMLSLLFAGNKVYAGHIRKRKIKRMIQHSQILNGHFTGFALYDLDKEKMILELNDDKYFTPASNTKLFTFYTCLRMLGDSIPAFKYKVQNDSLIFWGTGDPAFLHPDLKGEKGYDFLRSSNKKLFFASGNYQNEMFGDGWAWNDYNDDYQAEISEFPIMGNVTEIRTDNNCQLQITPRLITSYLKCDSNYKPTGFKIKRDYNSNMIVYPAELPPPQYKQEVPFKTIIAFILNFLSDTLNIKKAKIH